jgi:hypothetical protein
MTLIGVAAVIVSIGFLVLLLLPAVQQRRENSRLDQCTNKMKQLGVALKDTTMST